MPQGSSDNRQAGVEVTPEMIAAGVDELSVFDSEHDNGFEFVRRLYQTMAVLAPRYQVGHDETSKEAETDRNRPTIDVLEPPLVDFR